MARIAWFTPLYHLVNVCRALAAGTPGAAYAGTAWIATVALLLAPFPFRMMRRRIIS